MTQGAPTVGLHDLDLNAVTGAKLVGGAERGHAAYPALEPGHAI
jgi:hypothetical protein